MGALRPRPRARDAGFTLMELMVTMVIMASLMGLGIGMFLSMGKSTAAQSTLADAESLIVNVRNASSRNPAALVVDPVNGTIQPMTQDVCQELHFDPRPVEGQKLPRIELGIEGRECDLLGAHVDPVAGRVGGALRLTGGFVNCRSYAAYDVTGGLAIELWMKPEIVATTDLVSRGEALLVRLEGSRTSGNRITVRLQVKDEKGPDRPQLSCPIPPVRPNEWLGVFVSYDRNEIVVSTDDGGGPVVRGRKVEQRPLAISPDAELKVGGFSGWLDDFRFSGVHSGDPLRMPEGVSLSTADGKPRTIRFVDGRLDPAVHPTAERISIAQGGTATTIEITPNGMLRILSRTTLEEAAKPTPTATPPKKE